VARIVVAASPLSGHVLPMVRIATHLRELGHDVVLITADRYRRKAERAGLVFEPLAEVDLVDEPPRTDSWRKRLGPGVIRRYLLGRAEMRSVYIRPLVSGYRSLERVLSSRCVDVVLVDLTFTGALPLLLARGRRPTVAVVGVGPMTLSSTDTPPFGMAWQPRSGTRYDSHYRIVHQYLLSDIQSELDDALSRCGAPPSPVALTDWPRLADRLIQLTVPAFEYPRCDLPDSVDFVGPVLGDAAAELDEFDPPSWWGEVTKAQTVVHVTQGTLDNADLDQLVGPSMAALAHAENVVVVATVGHRAEQKLRSTVPVNAFICEWIPYSLLLQHVDIMITNGGYGGVHHALRYGIPLIVAGESSDKAEIGARVAYSGTGINLKRSRPRAPHIAEAVQEIQTDSRYRIAAQRLSRDIAHTDALDTIARIVTESAPQSMVVGDGETDTQFTRADL
jgi:UDP:flavonoid glycosyltransferase YjiC (YdhE family)